MCPSRHHLGQTKEIVAGLEIATNMVANATKTFNLATKKLSLVTTLATILTNKILKVRNNLLSLISAFLQRGNVSKSVYLFKKNLNRGLESRLFKTTLQWFLHGDRGCNILFKGC